MYLTLVDVTLAEADLDEYVAARIRYQNPAMAAIDSFHDTTVLASRAVESDERLVTCVVMNRWVSLDGWRQFVNGTDRSDFLAATKPLVRSESWQVFEQVDAASIEVGNPAAAGMFAVGRHRCHPGRGADYLAARRDVINPSIRKAPGFIGTTVSVDTTDSDYFVVYFRWQDDESADTYFATPEHTGPVFDSVRDLVSEGLVPSVRYDLIPL